MKCFNLNKLRLYLYITIIILINITCTFKIKQKESQKNITISNKRRYDNPEIWEKTNYIKHTIFNELDQEITDNNFKKHRRQFDDYSHLLGEYYSTKREIKLFISHDQTCSVYVNDTVNYSKVNNVNFIEHMILHNNAESIDPKSVYSDDVSLNFFSFNKKLNIFSVYFEPKKTAENQRGNSTTMGSNFAIEFSYNAVNLIKTLMTENKNENYTHIEGENKKNYNSFIWKILNQNFIKYKEDVVIDLYFDLGRNFVDENVEFSLNFTKIVKEENKKHIVQYHWEGVIDPQEVIILQAKFLMYFDSCGNISINLVMILIGSIFIIFLIGMLYIILSTVFSGEP